MSNKNISKFMEELYKINDIKDVSEAFIDYPSNEEIWIIQEPDIAYRTFKVGDIVYVENFKYPNGSNGETHMFVIIDKDMSLVPLEFMCMLLSSHIEKLKYKTNKLLKKDNKNNLHLNSIVKTDNIYRVNENQIKYKVGEVKKEKIEEYKKCYLEYKKSSNL